MSKLTERPLLNIALGILCIVAVAVAYKSVGAASPSTAQGTRTATVQTGVVQSTVSGSGNIQAASQLDLGFKTSGTVTHIYVREGEHVVEGKLLATLDPQSAEVTLEQARANLQSAEANLAAEEESGGEGSSAQGSTATTGAQASTASIASNGAAVAYIAADTAATTTQPTPPQPAPTSSAPSTTPATTTTPTATPTKGKSPTTTQKSETTASKSSESSSGGSSQSSSSSTSASTISSATREANLASAKAAVKSDKLTVQSDEQAVQNTKLYAPQDGTIVELSGEVGETVSATGTTKASTASSSSSSSTSATGSSSSPDSSTGSSNSSSSSSSSSFAVLSNLSSMQLVVPLSESEIGNVKVGQTATVTIEALGSRKVAAHVLKVDALATSNSAVVSYDVTFQLDQQESDVKVGMSASAEVVVKQAEGVNVPTTAISRGSVTVVRGGKHISQAVRTGLAGDSSTIILSGLKAGEEIVLPSVTTTSSSKASGARLGGLGGAGAFRAGGPPGG